MNTVLLSKYCSLKVRDDLQREALVAILNSNECMDYLRDEELFDTTSTKQTLYIFKAISALVALNRELEDDEDFSFLSDMEIKRKQYGANYMADILEKECNYLSESEEYKDQLNKNKEQYYEIVQ